MGEPHALEQTEEAELGLDAELVEHVVLGEIRHADQDVADQAAELGRKAVIGGPADRLEILEAGGVGEGPVAGRFVFAHRGA